MSGHIDRILEEVHRAQTLFAEFSEEKVDRIIDAIHNASMPNLEKWARMAHEETDRKSTRLNSSHRLLSRMPSSA